MEVTTHNILRHMALRHFILHILLFSALVTFGQTSEMREDGIVSQWTTMVRPTFSNPLTAYYRFVHEDGTSRLEMKISAGGVSFIVTQGANLELEMENGDVVTLANKKWQRSCKGCGSRGANADIPGVTLQFEASRQDIETLAKCHLAHVRLHLPENVLGGHLTLNRTEMFMDEVSHFQYCVEHL